MYLFLATILIVLEAVYEGLKYDGKHKLSGSIEFVLLALTTFISFAWITGAVKAPVSWIMDYPIDFWKIIVAYIVYRFGCFDPIINLVRGQKITYIGDTKNVDKAIRWFIDKTRMGDDYFIFIRVCCFIAGGLVLVYGNTGKI